MIPAEWTEDGLDKFDMTLVVLDVKYPCKNKYETSFIDYVLVSRSLAPFIRNITTVGGSGVDKVPWSPHYGIHFEIVVEVDSSLISGISKPNPISINIDSKSRLVNWSINNDEWDSFLCEAAGIAQKRIHSRKVENSEQMSHAAKMACDEKVIVIGTRYAQWSIAAEQAQARANGIEMTFCHARRGMLPRFRWRGLADKSILKYVEHQQWEMTAGHAIKGADLFSTAWTTIASILRRMGNYIKYSNGDNYTRTRPRTSSAETGPSFITSPPTARVP